MRNIEQIKDLATYAVQKKIPTDFSNATIEDVNLALQEELAILAKDYNTYRRNKYDIFEIIQVALDVQAPKKVMDAVMMFAEVKQFKNNEKPTFKVKAGRNRAKRFVTKVGLSGNYEAFRLDVNTVDVTTYAIGGAAYIDFERMLNGDESIAESAQLLTEGMEEAIYGEIFKALRATVKTNKFPANNITTDSKFDAPSMAKLCNTVKAYGNGAVIFATPEFVDAMGPDAIVKPTGTIPGVYSPKDIEDIANNGYIGSFRGCPIVQIPQSFVDETNTETVFDPQIAYVFPTGGEKVVKVALEGNTIVKDWENRDNSMEIQAYKKMGIAILSYHNWAVYQNTSIPSHYVERTL